MLNRLLNDLHDLSRAELLRQFWAANDDFLREAEQLCFRDPKTDAYYQAKAHLHALLDELKRR